MENVTSQLVLAEHFDVSARVSQLISTYLYHFHPCYNVIHVYVLCHSICMTYHDIVAERDRLLARVDQLGPEVGVGRLPRHG